MSNDKRRRVVLDRNILVPLVATVLGVGMVVAGWVMQGRDYVPGLLAQFGSTLVMLVPLLYLGRMLEIRIRTAEEQAREISENLADVRDNIHILGVAARQDLDRGRRRRDEVFAEAARSPTRATVSRVLQEGALVGAVTAAGVRVPLSGDGVRLRARPPWPRDESIPLPMVLEQPDGTEIAEIGWQPGTDAAQFVHAAGREVATRLPRQRGTARDGAEVLRELVEAVRIAVAARTGETPIDLGDVVEVPNEQWVVCTDGLRCRTRVYTISAARLLDSRENWVAYMATKTWVDFDQFAEAYRAATALLSTTA